MKWNQLLVMRIRHRMVNQGCSFMVTTNTAWLMRMLSALYRAIYAVPQSWRLLHYHMANYITQAFKFVVCGLAFYGPWVFFMSSRTRLARLHGAAGVPWQCWCISVDWYRVVERPPFQRKLKVSLPIKIVSAIWERKHQGGYKAEPIYINPLRLPESSGVFPSTTLMPP